MRARITAGVLVIAAATALPWLLDPYLIATGARILVLGLLAVSVTMLTGHAGLPTLGQAAFFGAGAYAAALVARSITPVGPVQLVIGGVVGALLAAIVGTAAVRTRGVMFLMLTLAVGELVQSASVQWGSVTGGSDGLGGIPDVVPVPGGSPLVLDGYKYLWALAVAVLVLSLVGLLVASPLGLSVSGLRDSEPRTRALGYPVNRYLWTWFVLAGTVAGVAGALWTQVRGFVSPADLGLDVSAMALIAVLVGGRRSLPGAVAGTALVVAVRDVAGGADALSGHGPLLLGLALILAVYLLPRGIAGLRVNGRTAHAGTA